MQLPQSLFAAQVATGQTVDLALYARVQVDQAYGIEVEEFPPCDQYTLQGDAFSRVVLGQEELPHSIGDAVLNMRVIDAFFRSAKAGTWEQP